MKSSDIILYKSSPYMQPLDIFLPYLQEAIGDFIKKGLLMSHNRQLYFQQLQPIFYFDILTQGIDTRFSSKESVLRAKALRIVEERSNKEDEQLLKKEPKQLLLKYQHYIRRKAKNYLDKSPRQRFNLDDLTNEVNEVFLRRIIDRLPAYEGKAPSRAVFFLTIKRLIRERYRHLSSVYKSDRLNDTIDIEPILLQNMKPEAATMFPTIEIDFPYYNGLFELALRVHDLSPAKQAERIFCLKCCYRIRINRQDILDYQPDISEPLIEEILATMGCLDETSRKVYLDLNQQQLFEQLTYFVQQFRKKPVKADSLRKTYKKWLKAQMAYMLEMMPPNNYQSFDFGKFIFQKYS